jgi:hypothetical protein
MSPVRYVLGIYISEDAIVHSHRRENLTSCLTFADLFLRCVTGPMHRYNSVCVVLKSVETSAAA